jgi:hypothetical protein
VTTRRERELFARYKWAYDAYRDAQRTGDYSAFADGSPDRAKLARLWIDIREAANPTSGERHLRDPMEILWFEITRPSWDNF